MTGFAMVPATEFLSEKHFPPQIPISSWVFVVSRATGRLQELNTSKKNFHKRHRLGFVDDVDVPFGIR